MRPAIIILLLVGLSACQTQSKKGNAEVQNEVDAEFVDYLKLFDKSSTNISKELSEKYIDGSEYHLPWRLLLNDTVVICEMRSKFSAGLATLALYTWDGKKLDIEDVGCEGDCGTKIDMVRTKDALMINVSHIAYDPTDNTTSEWLDIYEVNSTGIELVMTY